MCEMESRETLSTWSVRLETFLDGRTQLGNFRRPGEGHVPIISSGVVEYSSELIDPSSFFRG